MVALNYTKTLDIDIVEAGKLVAQVLQEDFDFISKEINEMKYNLNTLSSVQVEDLNHNIEVRDAMNTLMKYYMVHTDYAKFMELQRCYGNV